MRQTHHTTSIISLGDAVLSWRRWGPEADRYSLGMLIYEVVVCCCLLLSSLISGQVFEGRPPFSDELANIEVAGLFVVCCLLKLRCNRRTRGMTTSSNWPTES